MRGLSLLSGAETAQCRLLTVTYGSGTMCSHQLRKRLRPSSEEMLTHIELAHAAQHRALCRARRVKRMLLVRALFLSKGGAQLQAPQEL